MITITDAGIVIKRLPRMHTDPLELFKGLMDFANPCHEPHSGRFCETETGGAATAPAEIRKWAKDNGYTVGDRGRIHQDIQNAYKRAQRAKAKAEKTAIGNPIHEPNPNPVAAQGNFDQEFTEASKDLNLDLRDIPTTDTVNGPGWSMPNGFPGPKLNELEARVRKVGEVVHNEITRRLEEGGIKEPPPFDRAKDRAAFKDLQTQISDAEIPFAERQRIREEQWGPHHFYTDEEHTKQLNDALERDYPGNKEKVAALRAKLTVINERLIAVNKAEEEYTIAYRGTALTVLSEARDGAYGNMTFTNVTASNKTVKEALEQAGGAYPDRWVVQSDAKGQITAKKGARGLHQESSTSEGDYNSNITVSADVAPKAISSNAFQPVAIHEVGHRFEGLRPHIKAMEWAFWARRAGTEKPSKLRKLIPGSSYKTNELGVSDKFIDPYIGKIYRESAKAPWESFQMGTQYLMGGSGPIWRDRDWAHFTLGLLAAG